MSREIISVKGISEPSDACVGSHCVRAGQLLFISGQVARRDGKAVGHGDALVQCQQALENIRRFVEEAGGSLDSVVSLSIFLRSIEHRAAAMQARAEAFCAPGPSATVVGGAQLSSADFLVEISAIAYIS